MSEISIIGLDLAKQVFQIHGADPAGRCVLRKQLKRGRFCSSSPNSGLARSRWKRAARPITGRARSASLAIARGSSLQLELKPYVKRDKNDAVDAEAICEAGRPTMRFVPVKPMENQAIVMLHRSRDLVIKNRTMLVNALRAHLAEFGFVTGKGGPQCCGVVAVLVAGSDHEHPEPDHLVKAMKNLGLRARIVDAGRQPLGDAQALFDFSQHQHARIR